MLRIIQNRTSASAQSYYSKSDDYSEGQELAEHWGENGTAQLSLQGLILAQEFRALSSCKIRQHTKA
jgi:hypothetical protein